MSVATERLTKLEGSDPEVDQLKAAARPVSFGDLIRVGSKVTVQAHGWGNGSENACALHAAKISLDYLRGK